MRAVVQRVSRASVTVDGEQVAAIEGGLLVLVGVATDDTEADARWLADKVRTLRVFDDDAGVMNRSVEDAAGAVLLVSQFTLHGDARRGRRPSYITAAQPDVAAPLFEQVAGHLSASGVPVQTGRFRTHMAVESVNDGPVTILLDSRKAF